MLRRIVTGCLTGSLLLFSCTAWAIAPYVEADKLKPAEPAKLVEVVENKLKAVGFQVIGEYYPKQLPDYAIVVVTDEGILKSISELDGSNIIGAAIRIGVKSDGTVSYMNPDYWYRAYFRGQFPKAEDSVNAVEEKLTKTLGAGLGFGGDETAENLPKYRYLIGMPRFDSDKNRLAEFVSFDQAVKTIRDNLAKGVANTSKVYEVVMPNDKLAVFGVGMNDTIQGDARWISRIGAQDEIAALPYEVYVVNNTAYALYGRFRIAVSFPNLSMGHFMRIVSTPEEILQTLGLVAGAKAKK